jgi:hypothetical protein
MLNHHFVIGNQNSYLVKRKTSGGVQLSRDPLNVMNIHSRTVCNRIAVLKEIG